MSGLLSGCIIARSSTREESGKKIGEATLRQLEVDSTTQDWVLSVLGEPTRRSAIEEGAEIWVYEYQLKKESRVGVVVLLSSEDEKIENQSVFLEFKNKVLTRYWIEDRQV